MVVVNVLCLACRYSVRYTSSLYALEIAERAAAAATRDIPWYFNTCCVVGKTYVCEGPHRDDLIMRT